jgi:hypothetical protein
MIIFYPEDIQYYNIFSFSLLFFFFLFMLVKLKRTSEYYVNEAQN